VTGVCRGEVPGNRSLLTRVIGLSEAALVKDKARSNLKASRMLIEKDLVDPAMSRLYYALFQAGVHALQSSGKRPRDLSMHDDWKHETVCGNASLCRGRIGDRLLFTQAKSLRVEADYRPSRVPGPAVVELVPLVQQFVDEVCS
jgi:hypothetical protein